MDNKFEQFCEYLLEVARNEKKFEVLRQKMAKIEDFEPYAAFCRIDRENKQFISGENIKNFLQDNKMILTREDNLNSFIKRYDFNNDSNLNFSE